MPPRHPRPLPRLWLMTDERQGETLWSALAALPRGSGVIFRHYGLGEAARKALFARVRRIARVRRLTLLLAGPPRLARAWRADGFHGSSARSGHRALIQTAAAHDPAALFAARQADLVLVSPVYPTRSHPGQAPLGVVRFGLLARRSRVPVIALGGMTRRRARALRGMGIYGWAGIDGLRGVSGRGDMRETP